MRLKKYISPEFEWLVVSLLEDALTPSNNPGGEFGGGDEDGLTGEEAEEEMNEGNFDFGEEDWGWGEGDW